MPGVGRTIFTFDFLVYGFLVIGAVDLAGALFAVIALLRRESKVVGLAALALNLVLTAIGGTFLILLPR